MTYTLSINDLQERIYKTAKEHGWWDEPRTFGDILALCHSELSEALEEHRNGQPLVYYSLEGKPEGIAVEMIDCIIRILDWAEHNHVNTEEIMLHKMDYNETREYRHGGKAL